MLEKKEVKDLRLSPLMDEDSIVLFQLFVLEIAKGTDKTYKIVYGWCISSTRTEIDSKIYCGTAEIVFSADGTKFSIYRVSLYHSPAMVVQLINKLCAFSSLKSAATDLGLDASALKFDVNYIPGPDSKKEFVLRPIIFNETNTLITRDFYEKYSLNSAYKSVPSFSLIINNLAKLKLLQDASSAFFPHWEKALLACLKYLKSETTLFFDLSGAARWGNIELINSQCSDAFENHNVWFENSKESVKIDHKEVTSSKQVTVIVEANAYTCNKKVIVGCFLTNGGQVTLDQCKEMFHAEGVKLETSFHCDEPISQIAVSVWVEEDAGCRIWYKHSVPLLRQIETTMGMVGTTGTIKSDWLATIAKSNHKTKSAVSEAEKISRASYTKMTIGNYDLDPWVAIDREFGELIAKINPPKSEGEFFPKGWSDESDEHGAVSFLRWFQKITDRAQKVMIQDPFFDTLGLDFLARTTNSSTEFIMLTCTQVESKDDDGIGTTEPNRAARIKKFLKDYPSILDGIKLEIYDMRNKGGGDKNQLHDRYMFIFEKNELVKGFHLSNSIQGATKYSPLLITPIPADILRKVNDHMTQMINDTETKGEVEIVPLVDKKPKTPTPHPNNEEAADPSFFTELKATFTNEKSIDAKNIDVLFTKLNVLAGADFDKAWSTVGYFLARTNLSDQIMVSLRDRASPSLNAKIEAYLKNTLTAVLPIGFREEVIYMRNAYQRMFEHGFEECLEDMLRVEGYIGGESASFGNWGAYYAIKFLIISGFDNYIQLIKFVDTEYNAKKGHDLSRKPILKLMNLLFNKLLTNLFWHDKTSILTAGIKSDLTCLQAISVAAAISRSVRHEPKMEVDDAIKLIVESLDVDKAIVSLCHMLFNHKKRNQEVNEAIEKKIFEAILSLLDKNFTTARVDSFFTTACFTNYPLIEKKVTDEVLLPIMTKGHIPAEKVFQLWSSRFWATYNKFETFGDYAGILDLTGWSFWLTSAEERNKFLDQITKSSRQCFNEIRKPFKKGSTAWQQAFERLFLIETVLSIVILYDNANKSKIDEVAEITEIIRQIEIAKSQFEPSFFHSKIQVFRDQIKEDYKAKAV